jgi:outer membrane protein W/uncharacterized protein YgiM (DUF1202 family)
MRQTKIFFIIITLLFSYGFASSSAESVKIKIIADKANVYLEPSENSVVMDTVEKGEVLEISETGESTGEWYNVSYESIKWGTRMSGFVKSSMTEILTEKLIDDEVDIGIESSVVLVIKEGLVLRLKPNENSLALKNIPPGAKLNVEESMGDWLKINLPPDKDGIVITGYIDRSFTEPEISIPVKSEKKIEKPVPVPVPVKEEKVEEIKPVIVYKAIERTKTERKIIGPKKGFGLTGGYAMPSEDNYKGGISYGGILHFGITKNIAVELSGLRFQSEVEKEPDKLSKGDLSIIAILMSIQFRFQVGSIFVPYIAGGGGYYLNDFSIDNELKEDWNLLGFDINEDVENSFGFHVGGGFDIFLSDHIAFNGDVKYCLVNSKGSWTFSNQVISQEVSGDFDEIKLNSLIFGVSLKILF